MYANVQCVMRFLLHMYGQYRIENKHVNRISTHQKKSVECILLYTSVDLSDKQTYINNAYDKNKEMKCHNFTGDHITCNIDIFSHV